MDPELAVYANMDPRYTNISIEILDASEGFTLLFHNNQSPSCSIKHCHYRMRYKYDHGWFKQEFLSQATYTSYFVFSVENTIVAKIEVGSRFKVIKAKDVNVVGDGVKMFAFTNGEGNCSVYLGSNFSDKSHELLVAETGLAYASPGYGGKLVARSNLYNITGGLVGAGAAAMIALGWESISI